MASSLKLRQIRSLNGASRKQRATLRALGLGRIGNTAERPDDPGIRGQIRMVGHLLEVKE